MSWELRPARGVLVWQGVVALAKLEFDVAAIVHDCSALSRMWLDVWRRVDACISPFPTSPPIATTSSATNDAAPLPTLVSGGSLIEQSAGARSAPFWVPETETQILLELVGSRKNQRTP